MTLSLWDIGNYLPFTEELFFCFGFSSSPGSAGSCELLPPEFIRGRQENWAKYVLNTLQGTKTFISSWEQERSEALVKCKFKVKLNSLTYFLACLNFIHYLASI